MERPFYVARRPTHTVLTTHIENNQAQLETQLPHAQQVMNRLRRFTFSGGLSFLLGIVRMHPVRGNRDPHTNSRARDTRE